MSRHGTDQSEKTLSGISPNTSELWSEHSVRDLPHTLRLLNKASSVHSSSQLTDVTPSPLPHFIDSNRSLGVMHKSLNEVGMHKLIQYKKHILHTLCLRRCELSRDQFDDRDGGHGEHRVYRRTKLKW